MRDEEEPAEVGSPWQGRILIIAMVVLTVVTVFGLLFVDPDFGGRG